MGKAKKGTTARKQTKTARQEKQVSKRMRQLQMNQNEPINFRESDYGDFINRACFTFSLGNSSDILMLIEIILD